MATRALTVTSSDNAGNTYSNKYNYINPTATDAQLYNAAVNIISLSNNTFVSAIVTDTYELEEPTQNTQQRNTPLITRR